MGSSDVGHGATAVALAPVEKAEVVLAEGSEGKNDAAREAKTLSVLDECVNRGDSLA